jgi:hypothetical protein
VPFTKSPRTDLRTRLLPQLRFTRPASHQGRPLASTRARRMRFLEASSEGSTRCRREATFDSTDAPPKNEVRPHRSDRPPGRAIFVHPRSTQGVSGARSEVVAGVRSTLGNDDELRRRRTIGVRRSIASRSRRRRVASPRVGVQGRAIPGMISSCPAAPPAAFRCSHERAMGAVRPGSAFR